MYIFQYSHKNCTYKLIEQITILHIWLMRERGEGIEYRTNSWASRLHQARKTGVSHRDPPSDG